MRARNIKPGFFSNEHLAECPFEARLLFAGLWLMADKRGILEDRPKKIKGHLFPYDDVDVDKLLDLLHEKRQVVRYRVDAVSCIIVPTFIKHQNPHPSEKASSLPSPLCDDATDNRGNKLNYAANHADSLIPESLNPSSLNPESKDSASGDGLVALFESELVAAWNATPGVRQCTKISAKRRKPLRARIAEPEWRDRWREALAKFPLKCFEDSEWVPHFDWFLRPDTVESILDGKYDWSKKDGNRPARKPLPAGHQFVRSNKGIDFLR